MAVRILITGGTFDKEYDEIKGRLYFKETHMREILDLGRSRLMVKIQTLMMVDSLDMTMDDRQLILNNCRKVGEDQIVITHGTDTMVKTAELIANQITDKTIKKGTNIELSKFENNTEKLLNLLITICWENVLFST